MVEWKQGCRVESGGEPKSGSNCIRRESDPGRADADGAQGGSSGCGWGFGSEWVLVG